MSPLTGVINESWQLYKTHARHLLAIAFIIYLCSAIVSALLELIGGYVGLVLAFMITFIALFLLQAALVKAVQDVRDGRADLSISETFSAATPYIATVAGAAILAGIAIAIGLALLIIPGVALITIWCLIMPVIVLEQTGTFASFGRSFQLVKGYFWNVLGTLILLLVILIGVDFILGLIFHPLPHFLGGFLSSVIGNTLTAPFIVVVLTSMYFRLVAAPAPGTVGGGPYGSYGGQDSYSGPPPGQQHGSGGYPPPGPQDGGSWPPPGS